MKYQTNCFRVSDVKICPHCKNPKIIKKTYKKNHLGGFTKTESDLDFRGKPIFSETVHKRNASGVEVITKDFFEYDNRERLLKHSQSINNSTTKNLIAQNKYDRRGQLISKKVGGTQTNAADRWQEVRYNYNIRGWLTYINNPMELVAGENTIPPTPNDDLFAFNIRYINPTNDGESLYNGNISQTIWKTASDNTQRGYNYTYDRLNRLRRADFYKQGAGNLTAYGEFITYDLNGNITHLTRTTGDASDNDIDMDDLSYTYDKDGLSNLLVNVADAVTTGSNEGFKDGNTNPDLDDYECDANGNMVKDRNKGISNITYNHLNLPTEIKFEGTNNKITYLYNSVGQKLKKTVVYSDSIKIVDYLDGFQTEERGSRTPKKRRSHKTNNNEQNHTATLASFDLEILDFQSLTRPFGLKHSVYAAGRLRDFEVDFSNPEEEKVFLTPVTKTEYQYKYNGQEWQDELGLNMYAMDMRQYDPAIGRWVAQDPVTHFDYSPYSAFDNNPVFWADPSGADAVDIGYDRTIDSQDMMGSYHWSGGFQEVENEGGEGMETQKANTSASEQRSYQDNGDDPPTGKNKKSEDGNNYKYNFKAGHSYNIKTVRRVLIGTPGGSLEKIDISDNNTSISTGYDYSYPGAGSSLSPKSLKASLFLKTHSSTITFHQNVSGNSLQEIFNQTDGISSVTMGAVIYYNYIEGTRNGQLFWHAHQKGHGLATPFEATVITQSPIFK